MTRGPHLPVEEEGHLLQGSPPRASGHNDIREHGEQVELRHVDFSFRTSMRPSRGEICHGSAEGRVES